MHDQLIYIFIMGLVTFLIRAVPVTVFNRPIRNRFIRSFLHYVPYVTLSVMTFPAITTATGYTVSGYAALLSGIICAWRKKSSLLLVSFVCCLTVLIVEFFLSH